MCVCVRACARSSVGEYLRVRAVGVGAGAQACACARVPLVIHHATRMPHIAICGLSGSTVFFDIIS
jgi:hypothetical protein